MVGAREPKVTEVNEDEISSGESSEEEDTTSGRTDGVRSRHNKGERKNKKMVQKLGLKPLPKFEKIIVRGAKGLSFQISDPDVYPVPGTKSYIVFGEAKLEDRNAVSQAAALANATSQLEQKLAAMKTQSGEAEGPSELGNFDGSDQGDESCNVDGEDVDSSNIDLVVNQTGCSRAKAAMALKLNNNDVVEAILYLSS